MKSIALAFIVICPLIGAELAPATVSAWDAYAKQVTRSAEDRAAEGKCFLWLDESPDLLEKVRAGEIVAAPHVAPSPMRVDGGLIHHWIGASFIRGVTIADVSAISRDYSRFKEYFPPNVLDSRALETGDNFDRSSVVIKSSSLFFKAALDAEYESHYVTLDPHRLYTITHTTHIQEVEGYRSPSERRIPEGEGSGMIWRVMNISRYVERDGGVYMELEALLLSREIPSSVKWIAEPIVRRLSRSSIMTSLKQTGAAVQRRQEAMGHTTMPQTGKAYAKR